MKKTGRKGVTLAELCVVLALIAAASAMVVSFAVLVGARTSISSARLDAMNDLELVESVTEGWMLRVAPRTVLDYDGTLRTGSYTLSFSGNTLTGTLPDGESLAVSLDRVVKVEYKLLKSAGDPLCICRVELQLPKLHGSETETRILCVNPNVGDTYGQVTP